MRHHINHHNKLYYTIANNYQIKYKLLILLCVLPFISIWQLTIGPERTTKTPNDFLNSYISIKYVGETTQPCTEIILYDDQTKINIIGKTSNVLFAYVYINGNAYNNILTYIYYYKKYTIGIIGRINVFTYMITICDNNKKSYYFVHSGVDIGIFFKNLLAITKKNNCDKQAISYLSERFKHRY